MAVIYEVKVRAGTYQKDGQEKVRYQHIGDVIETKKGPMLKLHSIPLVENGWTGWSFLFPPQPKDGEQKFAPQKQSNDGFPPDEEMPF